MSLTDNLANNLSLSLSSLSHTHTCILKHMQHMDSHTHPLTCVLTHTDPDDLVEAPPIQYAVNGTTHTLQCSVNDENALVTWIEPGGSFDDREEGPYVIESVRLDDQADYTCVVYFSSDDIFVHKTIHLSVVGEK